MMPAAPPRTGAVLIVVMCIVTALSVLAVALAFRTRLAIMRSTLLLEGLQQDELARAAVVQACNILASDDANVDSLGDTWCGWHEVSPAETGAPLSGNETASWRVSLRLVDESGKINVNLAFPDVLLGLQCSDYSAVASLLDWVDKDDVPNPDGAENEYYNSLEPPYNCKDGPIDHIEELLLIKGITPQVFYGSGFEQAGDEPPQVGDRAGPPAEPDENEPMGLCELLTTYGDGRININTASRQVLEALPLLSDAAVDEIVSRQKDSKLSFASVDDIQGCDGFTLTDKLLLMQIVRFDSNHFRLHVSIAKQGIPGRFGYTAVIERRGGKTGVLSWQRKSPVLFRSTTAIACGDRVASLTEEFQ
jgi:general secretion pathway protein K